MTKLVHDVDAQLRQEINQARRDAQEDAVGGCIGERYMLDWWQALTKQRYASLPKQRCGGRMIRWVQS